MDKQKLVKAAMERAKVVLKRIRLLVLPLQCAHELAEERNVTTSVFQRLQGESLENIPNEIEKTLCPRPELLSTLRKRVETAGGVDSTAVGEPSSSSSGEVTSSSTKQTVANLAAAPLKKTSSGGAHPGDKARGRRAIAEKTSKEQERSKTSKDGDARRERREAIQNSLSSEEEHLALLTLELQDMFVRAGSSANFFKRDAITELMTSGGPSCKKAQPVLCKAFCSPAAANTTNKPWYTKGNVKMQAVVQPLPKFPSYTPDGVSNPLPSSASKSARDKETAASLVLV